MMKTYFLASFSLLFLMTCDKADGVADCSAVSCLAQSVSIEFVDMNRNNLIANETYSLNTITITKGGNQVTEDQGPQEIEARFFLSGTAGENTYSVVLEASGTDLLKLNLNEISPGSECCSPTFGILSATYNGSDIEVVTENNRLKVVVVKSLK